MGMMHRVAVPWVSGPPLRQLEELAVWGEMLKSDMIVAFTAHPRDVHMEGNYWLAKLSGPAFPVPESQVACNPCANSASYLPLPTPSAALHTGSRDRPVRGWMACGESTVV